MMSDLIVSYNDLLMIKIGYIVEENISILGSSRIIVIIDSEIAVFVLEMTRQPPPLTSDYMEYQNCCV